MHPERTIFDLIFRCSMHLNRTFLLLQKDAAKEVYKYPLEHSVYMDVLTQVWKYVERYPVPVYVYEYEGNCRCKSAAAKIIKLRNNKNNFSKKHSYLSFIRNLLNKDLRQQKDAMFRINLNRG